MAQNHTHEQFFSDEVKIGSDRSFGLVFAFGFLAVSGWPLLSRGEVRWWAAAAGVLVLAVTLLNPQALGPLNRAWFKFGLVLSSIMTPVIMGFLFLVAIVPTALILRCRGRNLLDLEFDPDAASYWIVRDPPGPMPETMRNQF